MTEFTREQVKKIFKKVKKLRFSTEFNYVDFKKLTYYSWLDQSDMTFFVLYDYKKLPVGIRFGVVQPPAQALRLGFCEFCHKHRKQAEVFFIAAETKKKPKGINYRSRGTWICSDYKKCNEDLKNDNRVNNFFERMLE